MASKKSRSDTHSGQVRIIAGDWRGRRLDVLDAPGLRPTGDRVRETLFNWLQWELPGRRCLDLFAGTGALSFEALSRGASKATLVEAESSVCQQLRESVASLGAEERAVIHQGSWDSFLKTADEEFDLVFVDPPFADHLQGEVLRALCGLVPETGSVRLSGEALVYVEAPGDVDPEAMTPPELKLIKSSSMGEVTACLMERRL